MLKSQPGYTVPRSLQKRKEELEEYLEELETGRGECEFLESFLRGFPADASYEVLKNLLMERNTDLDQFVDELGLTSNSIPAHASDLFARKLNGLSIQMDVVKQHLVQCDKEEKIILAASAISQLSSKSDGKGHEKLVDIREDYTESHAVSRSDIIAEPSISPPESHRIDISTYDMELDPELAALLDEAEVEEAAVPAAPISLADRYKLIGSDSADEAHYSESDNEEPVISPPEKTQADHANADLVPKRRLKPEKHVSFAPVVHSQSVFEKDDDDSLSPEHFMRDDESKLTEGQVDEFDDSEESSDFEEHELSSVLGVPKSIWERYMNLSQGEREPGCNSQSEQPADPISPLHDKLLASGLSMLSPIAERNEEEMEGDSDDEGMESDSEAEERAISQKELNLAYLRHYRRHQARLQQKLHNTEMDEQTFYDEHNQQQRELVRDEMSKLNLLAPDGTPETHVDEQRTTAPPKKISKFKQAQRIARK